MPKILVIDENEMNRDSSPAVSPASVSKRRAAVDGREGLDGARHARPDLILMDVSLPMLDGWEATRRIKADPESRSIPAIALTAHAMASDRERALEAGCDDHDANPIEFANLLAKIEALLANPSLRR